MNIFEKLTNQFKETLDSAAALALHSQNQEIDVAHIFWALLTNTQSILNQALNKLNIDKAPIELEARSAVDKLPKSSSVAKENLSIGKSLGDALAKAQGEATTTSSGRCSSNMRR